jgi:HD-like signal output (HDOD) protein
MLIFPDHSLLDIIEKFCRSNKLEYIDGITSYCAKNNIEVEIVAELIKKDPVFTAKMQREAENLNFVKKTGGAKLPF